jgi:hypothetical protein
MIPLGRFKWRSNEEGKVHRTYHRRNWVEAIYIFLLISECGAVPSGRVHCRSQDPI